MNKIPVLVAATILMKLVCKISLTGDGQIRLISKTGQQTTGNKLRISKLNQFLKSYLIH